MRVPAGRAVLIASTVGAVLAAGSATAAKAPDLVSSLPGGGPANEQAAQQSLSASADGRRIVFTSSSPDLVPGDTNGVADVFVRDLDAGTTTRISVSSAGAQANKASSNPEISADGRFAVFSSLASNLAPADSNGVMDVFVRDIDAGTTARVSISRSNLQAIAASGEAPGAISADGRFVTFSSRSANLVPGDTNLARDVLVLDRDTRVLERADVTSAGAQAPQGSDSTASAISADGRYVAFVTTAALVPADANGVADVYLRDRQAGTTSRVSLGSASADGLEPDGLSADGSRVAFRTAAALVPQDTNGLADVYVRDLASGDLLLASATPSGAAGNGASTGGRLSADGRVVTFASDAGDLVAGDGHDADVFVRDLDSGATALASDSNAAGQASAGAALSGDGHSVVFSSTAPDLVAGDSGSGWDAFRLDSPLDVPKDTTPPEIRCSWPGAGWHAANVVLDCTAADAGTGLASAGDGAFSLRTTVLEGEETADASTDTRRVCDVAGNCTTAGPYTGIRVDRRAPRIHIEAPAGGQEVLLGDALVAGYGCDDDGSGVDSCVGPVASGAQLAGDAPGAHTFTVRAVDAAGNTSEARVTWYVRYSWSGFEPPLRGDVLPHAQAGRTVPVKFTIAGAGGDVMAGPALVGAVACGSEARLGPDDAGVAPAGADVRSDGDGAYHLNWKTQKAWAGTCRQLVLPLNDGSVRRVTVTFD